MGHPDSSVLDLIEKIKSWIFWGNSYSGPVSGGFQMSNSNCNSCFYCGKRIIGSSCLKYHCQSCGRILCGSCAQGLASLEPVSHPNMIVEAVIDVKSCKLCFELGPLSKSSRRCSGKIYPSESPRQSPEPASPSFSGDRFDGNSPMAGSDASFSNDQSPVSTRRSPSRSDEDEGEDSMSYFFSTARKYFHDTSDVDSSSISASHGQYSFLSVGSSPSDSPSRIHINSNRVGRFVQQDQGETPRSQGEVPLVQDQAILEKPVKGTPATKVDHLSTFQIKSENLLLPVNFETNRLIWLPPPPDDVGDDENGFFTCDDEDDEAGDSSAVFSPTAGVDTKEPIRAVVHGHFRALVSQLLQGQGITATKDNSVDWLDIITAIAWQAANFVKPDTSKGGSMDPCDYVKVKCIASGNPSDSKLIKGVVCTKNIKHKRMMSQYKNTRLLLLGGALEYQRVPDQLASFNTLLQKENEHLKAIVSKIEAYRPNVLLVEKSVSSFAQEQLLAKEISLVLNVKRPLMERIARCTSAIITPSTDHLHKTRLGHCELFHLEKVSEEHEPVNQFNRKPLKTLMFFEGCPRRLGCTVVLRGTYRDELKKLKHVVQYAVFAAYHLSLETSFLADEGASLPKMVAESSCHSPEKIIHDKDIPVIPESVLNTSYKEEAVLHNLDVGSADLNLELGLQESLSELGKTIFEDVLVSDEVRCRKSLEEACDENLALNETSDDQKLSCLSIGNRNPEELLGQEEELGEVSSECYTANDNHQSIVVSFSSHCILNETVCERSRLLRVKFYGPSDKPLGRYLRDDLFDQSSPCRTCKESTEAHVICYTNQHGNLTINVRHLPSVKQKLPGEQDGKIWMWHRCLRCAHVEGIPPATRRVLMSDAAWGLSFGKFLELSFSNHATGNRVASCGHSLQRDCLRFYGFGSTVASFRYSPINILSVHLPPPTLEFSPGEQSWIRKEATELLGKADSLYTKISSLLQEFEQKILSSMDEFSDASELHNHISELNDILANEKSYCEDFLLSADKEDTQNDLPEIDILEINRLRHTLVTGSRVWDRRLSLLDTLLKRIPSPKASVTLLKGRSFNHDQETNVLDHPKIEECTENYATSESETPNSSSLDEENINNITSLERNPSAASILSDQIDFSWSGADRTIDAQLFDGLNNDASGSISFLQMNKRENPALRKLMSPARVYSFDSAVSLQEKMRKQSLPPSMHLSTLHSFHASGDYRSMIRDPVSHVRRTSSHLSVRETEKSNLSPVASPTFVSSKYILPEGGRLIGNGQNDIVVIVYDDEPTSVISYALSSRDYEDWIAGSPHGSEGGSNVSLINKLNSLASDLSTWQSFGSLDLDYMQYGSYGSEDTSATVGSLVTDPKSSPHLRIAFEDESSSGKVKFSVTCYFAKQFDALRRRCCPSEVDFVRSLSRCRRWSAQGGKSNVYFAKSSDERFIMKQVTKTELESFNEFAPEYFKYLTDALSSGSPTCLAKVLGIYQVVVKHSRGGKEIKMDLMVMENLFYKRNISRVYDLKGSARSRYNADTTGANKVLLDMNLLETLRTNPIFLGSKPKRILERAVWNDTSFLASVDVMDYSLLVGVDEERKELVVGIIDFMRQYTWDKHLETWVKASGILGGPKNASPTIVSPKQYKKRFRKAMTNYFLTVPDQWSSS